VAVHSILPQPLTDAIDVVLAAAGIAHVAHGDSDPVQAATIAAADPNARAVIGPYRSRDVAEAVEVTAPVGLPMLAPVATWVGVTRDDEPGCEDDPADHRGTVLRMVARDSVVARLICQRVRDANQRAIVIAGDHEYGRQLDAQLTMHELPRAVGAGDADVIVLAGLAGQAEIHAARLLAPLAIVAFDGIQPERFPDQDVLIALVHASTEGMIGVPEARRAAELTVAALQPGGDALSRLRDLGPFDAHGDLVEPTVRFERYAKH
jgi:hypothetical protein